MSEKRQLEKSLAVRLTPSVYNAVVREAERLEITSASVIRMMLDEKYSLDNEHFPVVKAYAKRRPLPEQDVIELSRLREAVAELCGSLVYSSMKARVEGEERFHADLESIIPAVKQSVLELDALKRRILKGASL